MFNIVKGCDLLPKKAVEDLTPQDLQKYNEAAAKFVADFNAAYPDGKTVKVAINSIVVGDNERVNFVVGKTNDLSTQSIGLPFVVVDRIAENLGCGNTEGLLAIQHSTVEPLTICMTVKAVKAGDEYKTNDGTVRTYKVPAIVKIDGSREELQLSDDAADIIADMQREVLKQSILDASRSRRKAKGSKPVASPATTATGSEDDSDV